MPNWKRRTRDAWRVLQGKQLKYTAIHTPAALNETPLESLPTRDEQLLDACLGGIDGEPLASIDMIGSQSLELAVAVGCRCQLGCKTQIVNLPPNLQPARMEAMLRVLEASQRLTLSSEDPIAFLQSRSHTTKTILVLNVDLAPTELRKWLKLASQSGYNSVIGRHYDVSHHDTMDVVHEYPHVRGEESLWRIDLSTSNAKTPVHRLPLDQRLAEGPGSATTVRTLPGRRLVSIIVPAYEARPFIEQAMHDVARQTHKNWELIVVEDASPNSVHDLVDKFRSSVPENNVVFHRKAANSGASATRNVAIGLANGDTIAFLDADDRWLPIHLARKIEQLEHQQADIVYSAVDVFDDATGDSLYSWGPDEYEQNNFPQSLFIRNFIQPSAVVMRRSVLEDVGLFDENVYLVEDYDFWLRSVRKHKMFVFDRKITSRYRRNHVTASTTGRMVMCYDGVARVAYRNADLIDDRELRKHVISKHLITAGLGHLGHRPSKHNLCNPATGHELIELAREMDPDNRRASRWSRATKLVLRSGTLPLFRKIFRQQFKWYSQKPMRFEFEKAAASIASR
jgi:glycosyltransferase involved in cell wall biosynthesis